MTSSRAARPTSQDPETDEPSIRVLRPRRAGPADALRPTRAEVSLAALRGNLHALRRHLQAAERAPEIWGVLKADGYGHGAPAVGRTLERAGIDGLCVALIEEAVELREAGIRVPVLVMGGYFGPRRDGFEEIVERDLVPVLYDPSHVERLGAVLREQGRKKSVHLKVDTGMGRLGLTPGELEPMARALGRFPEVRPLGLMTHLACADSDDLEPSREQLRRFAEMRASLRREGVAPSFLHAANSAGTVALPDAHFDAVRPGLALYGVAPRSAGSGARLELRPAIRVRTEIVALRTLQAGDSLGYGYTFQAARPTVIATVPMGYADGLSRGLSNRGHLLVRGARAPIAGAVSMDMAMIDVTAIHGVQVGDEAVVLGAQEGPLGKDAIHADEIAGHVGTISWEVLTSISRRVPRFYREP